MAPVLTGAVLFGLSFCQKTTSSIAADAAATTEGKLVSATKKKVSAQSTPITVQIDTDKGRYQKGEEIHFTIDISNISKAALRVFFDETFVGGRMSILDSKKHPVEKRPGLAVWSPKEGVMPGSTYLLNPGDRHQIRIDALVADDYKLYLSNEFGKKDNGLKEFKQQHQLSEDFPAKYIGAGHIFVLPKRGTYQVTYTYRASEDDKEWNFAVQDPSKASVEKLWIGEAVSNVLQLVVE